jgi:hypothetical protein
MTQRAIRVLAIGRFFGSVLRPKNRGPDQRVPVITRATSESDLYRVPRVHDLVVEDSDPSPLPDEDRPRARFWFRYMLQSDFCSVIVNAIKKPLKGWLDSAERSFLKPVGDRSYDECASQSR